jgi:hypothetical protein
LVARIEIDYDGKVCQRMKLLREDAKVPHEADLFVTSGPHPPDGDPVATLVWLTFCTAGLFANGMNANVRPLTYLGMAYERADIRLNSVIRLADDGSRRVQSRHDIHPAFEFLWTNNRLDRRPIARSFTNLAFSVLAWTNTARQRLPVASEMTLSSSWSDARAPRVDFEGALRLNTVQTANPGALVADLPSQIHVRDSRYSELGVMEPVYYKRSGGEILSVPEVRRLREFRDAQMRAPPPRRGVKAVVSVFVFGAVVVGPALSLLFRKLARRCQTVNRE